jgi:signal transduction histidine kinase
MRGSLRNQLIGWNIVSLMALLTGLGLVVRYTVSSALMVSVERSMERQIGKLPPGGDHGGGFGQSGGGDRPEPPPHGRYNLRQQPAPPGEREGEDTNVTLMPRHFDLQGNALGFRTMLSRESFEVAAKDAQQDTRRILINGEPTQVLSVPMYQQGRLNGIGQVGYRLTEIEEAIATLDRTLLFLLPLGLMSAMLGGVLLTNRVLRRIHDISLAAQGITESIGTESPPLSKRLPVQGSDEFSELAGVLNTLLARQEDAYQEQRRALEFQRRFTGDASHELKSPLTVIKGLTSIALERASHYTLAQYQHSVVEIDHAANAMVTLVSDLLLLARSDSQQLGQQKIEVLVSEILERALRLTPESAPPVTILLTDPSVTIWGNESELIRLFANLISNARRYTDASGSVLVTASQEDQVLRVQVTDTGIGIAQEHLPHLGERFYRVDSSRNQGRGGTGLGLSICQSIVAAHQGTLEFASKVGEGTTITVKLPLAS